MRSLAVLSDLGENLRNLRPRPPGFDDRCPDDDPTQWVDFDPQSVWKSEQRAEHDNQPNRTEYHARDERDAPSASRGRSTFCGINHTPILADTLAPGTPVIPASGAHPRKIAEQMVMALQMHHSELDQKLADAWKWQAARDERTGF